MKFPERHIGECSTAEQAVVNRFSIVTGEHIGRYVEELSELPLPAVYEGLWQERNRINELQYTQLSGITGFNIRLLWIEHGLTLVERMARQLRSVGVVHDIYKRDEDANP